MFDTFAVWESGCFAGCVGQVCGRCVGLLGRKSRRGRWVVRLGVLSGVWVPCPGVSVDVLAEPMGELLCVWVGRLGDRAGIWVWWLGDLVGAWARRSLWMSSWRFGRRGQLLGVGSAGVVSIV